MNDSGTVVSGDDLQGSYAELISAPELLSQLEGRTPSPLEVRVIPEALKQERVFVDVQNGAEESFALLIPLAINRDADQKNLIITADKNDSAALLESASSLGLKAAVLPEEQAPQGASSLDDAQLVIAAFEAAVEQKDALLKSSNQVAFFGFESSKDIPSRDDFENFIADLEGKKTIWFSKGTPLTLSGVIQKTLRADGCVEIDMEKEAESTIDHEYYEVGRDLLSKPNAIVDLFEIAGRPKTIIFCNAPSDADLMEVLLNKKGIKAQKLIGHVPDRAVQSAVNDLNEGKLEALVVTDVSGNEMPVEEFSVLVNHSTPEDPEVYIHRLGGPSANRKLKRVVNLIGSTDLGNFHYLKKIVEFDFLQKELPSAGALSEARFGSFRASSLEKAASLDEGLKETVSLILEDERKEDLIAALLHNTLVVIPELESKANKGGGKQRRRDSDDDDGDRRSRGRGRDRRRDRDRDDDDDDRGNRRSSNRRSDRSDREELPPTKKDARFYLGVGSQKNFTEEKLKELLNTSYGEEEAPAIKRTSVRDLYSFVDFEEELAPAVAEKLEAIEFEGEKLLSMRAATIPLPREPRSSDDDSGDDEGTEEQASA